MAIKRKGQYFKSIEELYRVRFGAFMKFALQVTANKDLAIDVVHNAFVKTLEYKKANPERNVRESVVMWLIAKEAKKTNRISNKEVPHDFTLHVPEQIYY